MNHQEHLDEAATIHLETEDELAQTKDALATANLTIQAQAEKIATLEAAAGGGGTTTEPEYMWYDDFAALPSEEQYVVSMGAKLGTHFILDAPGKLRCVFKAGYKESDGDPILRSELMVREPGTNNHWRQWFDADYVYEIGFTIPSSYNPGVSSAPNEKRTIFQCHQVGGSAPPFALELIRPNGAPWNGQQNILRSVVCGVVRGEPMRAYPGKRYDVTVAARWTPEVTGNCTVTINSGSETAVMPWEGITAYDVDPWSVALHFGLYLPGSKDDPKDSKTELTFHYLRVRKT